MTKRVFPITSLYLAFSMHAGLFAQPSLCSDVFVSAFPQEVSYQRHCSQPLVGTITRGLYREISSWGSDEWPYTTLLGSNHLNYSEIGACLGALDMVILECEGLSAFSVDDRDTNGHRMRVGATDRTIGVEIVTGAMGGPIPIPVCTILGTTNYWNPYLPQHFCPEPELPGEDDELPQAPGDGGCAPQDPECGSPILISVRGNRLSLTSAEDGVFFDLNSDGVAERTAWTAEGADDAFLVLDLSGNGLIDNGGELFGNFTPQPISATPNGFLALAVHDTPSFGGNQDGWITAEDLIYSDLEFWIDVNHDGISQSSEMRPVSHTRVVGFNLSYRESRRTDQYGNHFRYISTVEMERGGRGPRRKFAVDVFFVNEPTP